MNKIEEIIKLKKEGLSFKEIGNKLGLHKDCVRSRYRRCVNNKNKQTVSNNKISIKKNGNECFLNTKSFRIKTVDQALEYAEIDTNIWEVDTVQINSWEVGRKNTEKEIKYNNDKKNGYKIDSGDFNTQTLWQVKVKLKKKINNPVFNALNEITENINKNPPRIPSVTYTNNNDSCLMEVSLVDHHFGKKSIDGTSLEDSNNLFVNATSNLIEKSQGFNIDKIVFPLGSDFFHIDSEKNTTTKGTIQDTEDHITDIFKMGCKSVIESVYMLMQIAPVHILYIPGNHDLMTSFYLCEYLKAWFNNTDNVIVDTDKLPRKYMFYGKNLIGYTHGKEEKVNDLARLIMSENFNDPRITDIKHLEFHKGHWHKKKELQYISGDTVGNVRIVELPSLSSTDMWHFSRGYVGAKRAAEAHIYSKEHGNIGNFICSVEEII